MLNSFNVLSKNQRSVAGIGRDMSGMGVNSLTVHAAVRMTHILRIILIYEAIVQHTFYLRDLLRAHNGLNNLMYHVREE